jgi:integrase
LHRNLTARGFEPARELAGLPCDLTFHDLRDAAISRMIAKGLDAVTVARLVGHEDPSVTLRVYATWFNRVDRAEQVRAALA